jgi:hypothetical protein
MRRLLSPGRLDGAILSNTLLIPALRYLTS